MITAPDIFPGFHTYVFPPDAVSVVEAPAHTMVCVADTEGERTGPGIIFTVVVNVHPLLSVNKTE